MHWWIFGVLVPSMLCIWTILRQLILKLIYEILSKIKYLLVFIVKLFCTVPVKELVVRIVK